MLALFFNRDNIKKKSYVTVSVGFVTDSQKRRFILNWTSVMKPLEF